MNKRSTILANAKFTNLLSCKGLKEALFKEEGYDYLIISTGWVKS